MAISKFVLDGFGKKGVRGGGGAIFNQMGPLRSLYEHSFQKNSICPKGIKLQRLPLSPGGLCRPQNSLYLTFDCFFSAKCQSQNFFWVHLGEKGREGKGLVAQQFLLTLKN